MTQNFHLDENLNLIVVPDRFTSTLLATYAWSKTSSDPPCTPSSFAQLTRVSPACVQDRHPQLPAGNYQHPKFGASAPPTLPDDQPDLEPQVRPLLEWEKGFSIRGLTTSKGAGSRIKKERGTNKHGGQSAFNFTKVQLSADPLRLWFEDKQMVIFLQGIQIIVLTHPG